MATMKEIARLAGVSQSTVSRVINGNDTVHPELRERVMYWVHKLNYQPNASARALVSDASRLIGLVVPDVTNPFFPEMIRAVTVEADHHGYSVLIADAQGNAHSERRAIDAFRGRRVEGVVLIPTDRSAPHMELLRQSSMPVVVMTQSVDGFPSVAVDHEAGGKLVARHLLDLGHAAMACVGSPTDPKLDGFTDGLAEAGVTLPAHRVVACSGWGRGLYHDAYERVKALLKEDRSQFTALFGLNDLAALGAIRAVSEAGLRVPDDVAVVGFDNTELAAFATPGLTSVAQPQEEIGRLAIEMLFALLQNVDGPAASNVVLHPRLVVRESTVGARVHSG